MKSPILNAAVINYTNRLIDWFHPLSAISTRDLFSHGWALSTGHNKSKAIARWLHLLTNEKELKPNKGKKSPHSYLRNKKKRWDSQQVECSRTEREYQIQWSQVPQAPKERLKNCSEAMKLLVEYRKKKSWNLKLMNWTMLPQGASSCECKALLLEGEDQLQQHHHSDPPWRTSSRCQQRSQNQGLPFHPPPLALAHKNVTLPLAGNWALPANGRLFIHRTQNESLLSFSLFAPSILLVPYLSPSEFRRLLRGYPRYTGFS